MSTTDVIAYKNASGTEVFAVDQSGNVTFTGLLTAAGFTTSLGLTFSGTMSSVFDVSALASGSADVVLRDNVADAWSFREGSNAYLTFVTTNSGEAVDCYKPFKVDTIAAHTGTTGTMSLSLTDNLADAFSFKEASTSYVTFVTTNSAERVKLGKPLSVTAGMSAWADLTAAATGEALVNLADNLAVACAFKEGSNSYLTFVTTDGSESVAVAQRLTTTDGVSSGTAKVVGGRAYGSTATAVVTNTVATEQDVPTLQYTFPANSLKAGMIVEIYAHGEVTSDSGADTLTVKLYFGGTPIVTTAAVNTSANDKWFARARLHIKDDPSGTSRFYGHVEYIDPAGTTIKVAHTGNGGGLIASNGALVVKVSATWSATTATNTFTLDALDVRTE